jgi:hypothetical protein
MKLGPKLAEPLLEGLGLHDHPSTTSGDLKRIRRSAIRSRRILCCSSTVPRV